MKLEVKGEERCLGQITRTQIKLEIKEGRGDCGICKYNFENNFKCRAYEPKVVRFFEIVD